MTPDHAKGDPTRRAHRGARPPRRTPAAPVSHARTGAAVPSAPRLPARPGCVPAPQVPCALPLRLRLARGGERRGDGTRRARRPTRPPALSRSPPGRHLPSPCLSARPALVPPAHHRHARKRVVAPSVSADSPRACPHQCLMRARARQCLPLARRPTRAAGVWGTASPTSASVGSPHGPGRPRAGRALPLMPPLPNAGTRGAWQSGAGGPTLGRGDRPRHAVGAAPWRGHGPHKRPVWTDFLLLVPSLHHLTA